MYETHPQRMCILLYKITLHATFLKIILLAYFLLMSFILEVWCFLYSLLPKVHLHCLVCDVLLNWNKGLFKGNVTFEFSHLLTSLTSTKKQGKKRKKKTSVDLDIHIALIGFGNEISLFCVFILFFQLLNYWKFGCF